MGLAEMLAHKITRRSILCGASATALTLPAINKVWAADKLQTMLNNSTRMRLDGIGSITLTETLVLPANGGIDFNGMFIYKGFDTTPLIDMSASGCFIRNAKLQGNSKTGDGIYIAGGSDQKILETHALGFSGYCARYNGTSSGVRSRIVGGIWQNATATNAAILWPIDALGDEGSRRIEMVQCAGAVLLESGGVGNGWILGCGTLMVRMSVNDRKIIIGNCRIANAAIPETFYVRGTQSVITGNDFSGSVEIATGATYNVLGPNVYANTPQTIKDLSGNSTNQAYYLRS